MKIVIDAEESFAKELQKQAHKKHTSVEGYIMAVLKTWMIGQMVFDSDVEAEKKKTQSKYNV